MSQPGKIFRVKYFADSGWVILLPLLTVGPNARNHQIKADVRFGHTDQAFQRTVALANLLNEAAAKKQRELAPDET